MPRKPWMEYTDNGVIFNCQEGEESFGVGNETFRLYGEYPREPGYWKQNWKAGGWEWIPEAKGE